MGQAGIMTEDAAKSATNMDSAKGEPRAETTADIPLLRIDAVVKNFGGFRAVDRLSLDIRAGEFFALLGPSGCGKTTLLRVLAGFEMPDEGSILLDGKDIAPVLPHQRPVNMMFQNYALFPHLTVRDNIAFGLRRAGLPRAEIDARVAEMVALVKLEGLEKRKPDQLSGGQRQRVALARVLRGAESRRHRRLRRRYHSLRRPGPPAARGRGAVLAKRRCLDGGRRAAPADHEDDRCGGDPAREGKIVAPRPGGGRAQRTC